MNRNKGDGGKHSVILGCFLTLFFEGASILLCRCCCSRQPFSRAFRIENDGERERRLLTRMMEMDIKWSFDGFSETIFPLVEAAFLNVWFLSLKL